MGYSDYKLHDFALQHGLTKFQLPDDAVLASGKCGLLVELLADLQASLDYTLVTARSSQSQHNQPHSPGMSPASMPCTCLLLTCILHTIGKSQRLVMQHAHQHLVL